MQFKPYIELLRPKHYLKNLLVLLPVVFSGNLFHSVYLVKGIYSFIAFSMIASFVYIINDIRDRDFDKKHERKKNRPISSGRVSVRSAYFLAATVLAVGLFFQLIANSSKLAFLLLSTYVVINMLYSFGLKNLPIIDISILSLGFLIRLFYGGESIGIIISKWLYLAVLAFSFYLSLGKRRNEIKKTGFITRKVNRYYTQEFLDKNMYACFALTIVFYSLWAVDPTQPHPLLVWTIPIVIVIAMAYSLRIERNDSDGDPISVLTTDKSLPALLIVYAAIVFLIIYIS